MIRDLIDKKTILGSFDPFINPKNYEGMIIGNDIDSILSACFLNYKFGWNIVGSYDYKTLWHTTKYSNFLKDLNSNKFVSVDLDINNKNNYSIGHHILRLKPTDKLNNHSKTLNPNLLRGIDVSSFKRKYPLGTIHFLTWLFDENQLTREAMLLIWLADSSFINGQSHRFRNNVKEWLDNFLKFELFDKLFLEIDTRIFEEEIMIKIFRNLEKFYICNEYGQVKSRHLGLSGFQCQWQNPNTQNQIIRSFIEYLAKTTGWKTPSFPEKLNAIIGTRSKINTSELLIKFGSLDNFLETKDVFSYVFPFRDSINYTTGLSK